MTERLVQQLERKVVGHLFVLVGNNPLPCFVAGKLLLAPGGTVHLVYTHETQEYAKRLAEVLHSPACKVEFTQGISLGDSRDPRQVFDSVYNAAACIPGIVGLHYTGGTKVMAVHAYQAIRKAKPDAIFSYLDPDKLAFCFERNGVTFGEPVRLEAGETNTMLKLTLHQLWQIHNKTPLLSEHREFTERTEPLLPGIAELLAARWAQGSEHTWEGAKWISAFKGKTRLADNEPLDRLPFPEVILRLRQIAPTIKTIGDLKDYLDTHGGRANNYLGDGGDWVEDLVLQALNDIKSQLALNDVVCSARTVRPSDPSQCEMELDVVAIRGYQLFVFSCYAGKEPDKCKLKLYEAAMRAQQLGGSEARFALVCGHQDKARVTAQMDGTLSTRSFRVFDRNDLSNLRLEIGTWIKQVDREAS